MSGDLLQTKLFVPRPRPSFIPRPHLIAKLNQGAHHKLTLISAPAGFGKTTLVSEWIAGCKRPFAWLSLDERDSDLTRFLAYFMAALQTLAPEIGKRASGILDSPEQPPPESILTILLNEIATLPEEFALVLDDYHVLDAPAVDQALTFFLEYLPPQMHLIIATREDPSLPLARLRVRGQLTELRAADLRFTPAEASTFLNQVMGLTLSQEEIAVLETRTEGWIAGLQLAALSMQGDKDSTDFIKSFTGSHHFVLDYLLEEVFQQQSATVQTFLLRTAILNRLCGPLCDAVWSSPSASGQEILEYLERANLFVVPLDNERRWYRYHHLFAELLQQRLGQTLSAGEIAQLYNQASAWYENNDIVEAFRLAAAAQDIERAERLLESTQMPLHRHGAVTTILDWLVTLPDTVRNARPLLWWKQAALMLTIGQTSGVAEILQTAETALDAVTASGAPDEATRDLRGRIATTRANLAQTQAQAEIIFVQARLALDFLHPNNLTYRSAAICALGFAHYWQGNWAEAHQAYTEALSLAQMVGNVTNIILASIGLGQVQENQNQLHQAAETYQHILQLIGDYAPPNTVAAYLGLAQIFYQWNDLDGAEAYAKQGLQLAQQYDQIIDRMIMSELHLALIKLARNDVSGAAQWVTQAEQVARQKNFTLRQLNIVYFQLLILLRQGNLSAAAQLAHQYELPLMQARVSLAQGEPAAALAVLEPLRQKAERAGWARRLLDVMTVESVALYADGARDRAVALLDKVLAQAEPGGYIRLFADEGRTMMELLTVAAAQGIRPDYIHKLLAAFTIETQTERPTSSVPQSVSWVEPLSSRELEVLRLIAEGLSNQEIGARLFLALDTVKGHNRRIFEKLQVQRRTEAIARARELGLL
ncbi:MAG: tetratricopeptide repeat protein [Chloroflexi bacterium]|nr:tetratricopeptide repeat protein [Chloroflexota bacterium]MBP8058104.1 tetratricopeptide repeat protein [Chloroflexota bacterium]